MITKPIIDCSYVDLLDVDMGYDFNRTVVTMVGEPEAVLRAAIECTSIAVEMIDMRGHSGEHARMGAVDVVPFIPIKDVSMNECVLLSREYAKKLERQFKSLNIHVELIGADDDATNGVQGYDKLKVALAKYGITYVRNAVDTYKRHIANNAENNVWNKPLNGGMILGLAAAYSLHDNLGEGAKNQDFLSYLNNEINLTTVKEHTYQTAGPIMDILIVQKLVKQYNDFAKLKNWTTIGPTVLNDWITDPAIHGKDKKKTPLSIEDIIEELD